MEKKMNYLDFEEVMEVWMGKETSRTIEKIKILFFSFRFIEEKTLISQKKKTEESMNNYW